MRKLTLAAAVVVLCFPVVLAGAQSLDDLNIQIHGYATQGFLYTTQMNIFYANSSDGSPAWTEAVVNLTAQPSARLRVGVQGRYQLLGSTGNAIVLDAWVSRFKVDEDGGPGATGALRSPARADLRVGHHAGPWPEIEPNPNEGPALVRSFFDAN